MYDDKRGFAERNDGERESVMVRIFKHYVPVQLVWLASVEFLILFLSMYLGYTLRFIGGNSSEFLIVGSIVPRAILFSLVMIITMTAFGMFTRESQTGDIGYYFRFLASFLVGSIAMTFFIYALPYLYTGRGVLALALGFAFVGSAVSRILFIRLVDLNKLKRRLLVVGTGSRAAKIGTLLEQNDDVGKKYQFIGYLVPGDAPQHPHVPQAKLIKDKGSLLAIVTRYAVDEIVTAIRDRRNSGLNMHDLLECKLEGVRVTDISSFFERETGHVQLDSLNPSWMIYSDGFQQTSARNIIKRIFDVMVSIALLLLTLPVTLITALLIVAESGVPVFYRQERVGECGQIFQVLKFRSMRQNAEKAGIPQWAKTNDDRVTRVGRVIRKLRIDELPQIINVMRGEMSFVGPRPERPYFVKQLADQIPHFLNRHTVKPGITGWAQIRYPYGSSVEDAVQKLQYDLYYAKNHSLFLDLIILFQTVQVVLFGKGAR
jgi:sugar transferase (PEP-CTERM system associated)